jgi:isocitrate dehydrogenase
VQGSPVEMGGYYYPSEDLVVAAMRPSTTFNSVIDAI